MGSGKDEESQNQKDKKMVLNKKAQAAMLKMMKQLQELAKFLTKLEESTQQDKGLIAQLNELRADIDAISSDVKQKGYVNASRLDTITLKMDEVAGNAKNIVFARNIDKAKARLAERPGANLMHANPANKPQEASISEESKDKEALQKMQQNILNGLKIFSKDKIFELRRSAQVLKNESKKQSKIDKFIHATEKWFSKSYKKTIGSLLQKAPPKAPQHREAPKAVQGERQLPRKPHTELLKEAMAKRQLNPIDSSDIDRQQAERRMQKKANKNPNEEKSALDELEDLSAELTQEKAGRDKQISPLDQVLLDLEMQEPVLRRISTVSNQNLDGEGMRQLNELLAELESPSTSSEIEVQQGDDPTHDEALSILDDIDKINDELNDLDAVVAQHEMERQQDKEKLQARSNIPKDTRRHSMTVAREVQEKQQRRQSMPPKAENDDSRSIKLPGGKKK